MRLSQSIKRKAMGSLDTTYHDRRLAKRLKEDAEFRTEFERQQRTLFRPTLIRSANRYPDQ